MKLICGDVLEELKKIQDESVDLIITSPPYNLGNNHHTGNNRHKAYEDNMPEEEYQNWQIQSLMHCWRVLKTTGSMFYNHKNRIKEGLQISPYEWIYKTKFIIKQEIVWENGSQNFDKIRFYPMTERIYWLSKSRETKLNNIINHKDYFGRNEWVPVKTKYSHKRAFPLQMPIDIISCFSEAKTILDPFMGSGTVGIACKKMGRDFIGIEINPDYFTLSQRNIDDTEDEYYKNGVRDIMDIFYVQNNKPTSSEKEIKT